MPTELKTVEFWFDFASNYSYLSAVRIAALAADARLEVLWRPFLLGPIFASQGWNTSPFNLYPAKGRNMIRDMERTTQERGLSFVLPKPFPQHSLLANRVATVGVMEGWANRFVPALFSAEFGRGAGISKPETIGEVLTGLGLEPGAVLAKAQSGPVKDALRERTAEAQEKGIFGAPTFIVGSELYWGDDRLEQALRFRG